VTDEKLIKKYLHGDEQAFNTLYQKYRKPVYAYLNNMLENRRDLVEDIFQQTWTRAISALDKYRDEGTFISWIYRIARNLTIDHFRREKRYAENSGDYETVDDNPGPSANEEKRELETALAQAIATLPESQREVVCLRQNDMPFAEIAKIQNVSINTALGRMHYAVEKLRRELQDFL
jgi:RNA polymerase sigma-70 factor, ECF subfamily